MLCRSQYAVKTTKTFLCRLRRNDQKLRVDCRQIMNTMRVEDSICEEKWHVESYIGQNNDRQGRSEWVALREPQKAGTTLLSVEKTPIVHLPTWKTLQVGITSHARFGAKVLKINHSSTPSTRMIVGDTQIEVVSTRDIPSDEALSFNYNTTEWDMIEPFHDWDNGEKVQGFFKAKREEQLRLLNGNFVALHIRELAEKHGML